MLGVTTLSIIILGVVILSVVAPLYQSIGQHVWATFKFHLFMQSRGEDITPWSAILTCLGSRTIQQTSFYCKFTMEQCTSKNAKQLFEHQHLLLHRDIWQLKF
jgi:hypothetical protein